MPPPERDRERLFSYPLVRGQDNMSATERSRFVQDFQRHISPRIEVPGASLPEYRTSSGEATPLRYGQGTGLTPARGLLVELDDVENFPNLKSCTPSATELTERINALMHGRFENRMGTQCHRVGNQYRRSEDSKESRNVEYPRGFELGLFRKRHALHNMAARPNGALYPLLREMCDKGWHVFGGKVSDLQRVCERGSLDLKELDWLANPETQMRHISKEPDEWTMLQVSSPRGGRKLHEQMASSEERRNESPELIASAVEECDTDLLLREQRQANACDDTDFNAMLADEQKPIIMVSDDTKMVVVPEKLGPDGMPNSQASEKSFIFPMNKSVLIVPAAEAEKMRNKLGEDVLRDTLYQQSTVMLVNHYKDDRNPMTKSLTAISKNKSVRQRPTFVEKLGARLKEDDFRDEGRWKEFCKPMDNPKAAKSDGKNPGTPTKKENQRNEHHVDFDFKELRAQRNVNSERPPGAVGLRPHIVRNVQLSGFGVKADRNQYSLSNAEFKRRMHLLRAGSADTAAVVETDPDVVLTPPPVERYPAPVKQKEPAKRITLTEWPPRGIIILDNSAHLTEMKQGRASPNKPPRKGQWQQAKVARANTTEMISAALRDELHRMTSDVDESVKLYHEPLKLFEPDSAKHGESESQKHSGDTFLNHQGEKANAVMFQSSKLKRYTENFDRPRRRTRDENKNSSGGITKQRSSGASSKSLEMKKTRNGESTDDVQHTSSNTSERVVSMLGQLKDATRSIRTQNSEDLENAYSASRGAVVKQKSQKAKTESVQKLKSLAESFGSRKTTECKKTPDSLFYTDYGLESSTGHKALLRAFKTSDILHRNPGRFVPVRKSNPVDLMPRIHVDLSLANMVASPKSNRVFFPTEKNHKELLTLDMYSRESCEFDDIYCESGNGFSPFLEGSHRSENSQIPSVSEDNQSCGALSSDAVNIENTESHADYIVSHALRGSREGFGDSCKLEYNETMAEFTKSPDRSTSMGYPDSVKGSKTGSQKKNSWIAGLFSGLSSGRKPPLSGDGSAGPSPEKGKGFSIVCSHSKRKSPGPKTSGWLAISPAPARHTGFRDNDLMRIAKNIPLFPSCIAGDTCDLTIPRKSQCTTKLDGRRTSVHPPKAGGGELEHLYGVSPTKAQSSPSKWLSQTPVEERVGKTVRVRISRQARKNAANFKLQMVPSTANKSSSDSHSSDGARLFHRELPGGFQTTVDGQYTTEQNVVEGRQELEASSAHTFPDQSTIQLYPTVDQINQKRTKCCSPNKAESSTSKYLSPLRNAIDSNIGEQKDHSAESSSAETDVPSSSSAQSGDDMECKSMIDSRQITAGLFEQIELTNTQRQENNTTEQQLAFKNSKKTARVGNTAEEGRVLTQSSSDGKLPLTTVGAKAIGRINPFRFLYRRITGGTASGARKQMGRRNPMQDAGHKLRLPVTSIRGDQPQKIRWNRALPEAIELLFPSDGSEPKHPEIPGRGLLYLTHAIGIVKRFESPGEAAARERVRAQFMFANLSKRRSNQ